jgi:hypothetical protein
MLNMYHPAQLDYKLLYVFFITDAVKAMVGVGIVVQDRPGSVPILDKGKLLMF